MNNQWISVKDRLPESKDKHGLGFENSEEVLIYNNGSIHVAWLQLYTKDNKTWGVKNGDFVFKGLYVGDTHATHWMPLPAPPQTNTK